MDKTLELKLKIYTKALASLEEVLKQDKSEIVKDSAIKRFEYTFEASWKTAKTFLSEIFGVDVFSPKECFRELGRNKILSAGDVEKALLMTDDRNKSVHNYDEKFAGQLYAKIANDYFGLLKTILENINKTNLAKK